MSLHDFLNDVDQVHHLSRTCGYEHVKNKQEDLDLTENKG